MTQTSNETTTFAQVTTTTPGTSVPAPRTVELPFWKALSILSGAVLVSIVGTAFAVGRVLNTDHFLLARAIDDIAVLKEAKVEQKVYEIQQGHILTELQEIKDILKENKQSSTSRSVATATPLPMTPVPQPTPAPQSTPQPVQINQTFVSPTAEPSASKAPEASPSTPEPNGPPATPPGLLKPILELL